MTPPPVTIVLPWPADRNLSPNTKRANFWPYRRAAKAYREACYLAAQAVAKGRRVVDGKLRATLRFIPPTNRNRDHDNLVARMKPGLDGVASALGVNDSRFVLSEPEHLPAQKDHARVELTLAVIPATMVVHGVTVKLVDRIEDPAAGATSPPSGQPRSENDGSR